MGEEKKGRIGPTRASGVHGPSVRLQESLSAVPSSMSMGVTTHSRYRIGEGTNLRPRG